MYNPYGNITITLIGLVDVEFLLVVTTHLCFWQDIIFWVSHMKGVHQINVGRFWSLYSSPNWKYI